MELFNIFCWFSNWGSWSENFCGVEEKIQTCWMCFCHWIYHELGQLSMRNLGWEGRKHKDGLGCERGTLGGDDVRSFSQFFDSLSLNNRRRKRSFSANAFEALKQVEIFITYVQPPGVLQTATGLDIFQHPTLPHPTSTFPVGVAEGLPKAQRSVDCLKSLTLPSLVPWSSPCKTLTCYR